MAVFSISRPEPLLFFKVTPELYSRGWVDPAPDPLLLRKSGSVGNRTRDFWICSQKLRPLDHRGGLMFPTYNFLFTGYLILFWLWRFRNISVLSRTLPSILNPTVISRSYNSIRSYVLSNLTKKITSSGNVKQYVTKYSRICSTCDGYVSCLLPLLAPVPAVLCGIA
jgi:hypothetical protein